MWRCGRLSRAVNPATARSRCSSPTTSCAAAAIVAVHIPRQPWWASQRALSCGAHVQQHPVQQHRGQRLNVAHGAETPALLQRENDHARVGGAVTSTPWRAQLSGRGMRRLASVNPHDAMPGGGLTGPQGSPRFRRNTFVGVRCYSQRHGGDELDAPSSFGEGTKQRVRRVLMESKELGYGSDGRGGESDVTAATTRAAVSKIEGALRSLEEAEDEVASLIELSKDADPEMREAALEELALARDAVVAAEAEVSRQVAPRPPADEGNAVLEIRGGTGGREAALFALDLWHMYEACAKRFGWRLEGVNIAHNTDGGARSVSAIVTGHGAYGHLRHETGVHRVQRVPTTETQGRVHTSTAVVVVLPEPTKQELPEVDERDVQMDTFRASGAGGQHVNTTDSAVRLTHIPTGVSVECQNERSQHQNKAQGMKVLRARIYDVLQARALEEQRAAKREITGDVTGDRSDRIRTYNIPQDRVTDHRTGESTSASTVLESDGLDDLVDTLRERDDAARLDSALDNLLSQIASVREMQKDTKTSE